MGTVLPSPAARNGRSHILCKIPAFGNFHTSRPLVSNIGRFSHKFVVFSTSFVQLCSAVTQIWIRVAADFHIPRQPAFKSRLRQSSQSGQLPGSPMAAPRLPHNHTLPLRPPMTGPVLWEALARKFFHVGFSQNKEVVSARPPPTDWETSGR